MFAARGGATSPTLPDVATDPLARAIAVVNGKGGTGKTSITANLGGLVADSGRRVLLVDLDPQGNLAVDLGYTGDDGRGLLASVATGQPLQPLCDVRPRLDVLSGGAALEDLAAVALSRAGRGQQPLTRAYRDLLAGVAADYDLVVVDCPPGLRVLQEMALAGARWVLIPTRSDEASLDGMSLVADRFSAARADNPDLQLLGVLLWGVSSRATRLRAAVRESIARDLGGDAHLLDSTVRYVEAAAVDARRRGQLVHELERDVAAQPAFHARLRDPDSSAPLAASAVGLAADYAALAREVLARLATREQVAA